MEFQSVKQQQEKLKNGYVHCVGLGTTPSDLEMPRTKKCSSTQLQMEREARRHADRRVAYLEDYVGGLQDQIHELKQLVVSHSGQNNSTPRHGSNTPHQSPRDEHDHVDGEHEDHVGGEHVEEAESFPRHELQSDDDNDMHTIRRVVLSNDQHEGGMMCMHTVYFAFSPEKEKLNGTNYADWIRNLRIVLWAEKKEDVLDTPLPEEPAEIATQAAKNAYQKMQFEAYNTNDMIVALQEMFQTQARTERFNVSKAFVETKLAEGAGVGSHVIKMVGYTQRLEKLGFPVGQELATGFILVSLPPSYGNFISNYHMHGAENGLNELCGMLKIAEADIKKGASGHPNFKKKGSWKKGKAKDAISKPTQAPKSGPQLDKECFHCHELGHWNRNCKVYLASLKKKECKGTSGSARGGFQYFITFTDDFSRYGYVYLMKHKSKTFEKLKEFQNEVENQRGKKIKALRSDRGGEYLSHEFSSLLKSCGIITQLTLPGRPQRNGVSERRNRTLLDMVRSMMSQLDLPLSFWGYALEKTAFSLNRETIGYYFYNQSEGKVFVARNVVFLEKEFLKSEKSRKKVYLEEVQDESMRRELTSDANVAEQVDEPVAAETPSQPRRSDRVSHPEFYPKPNS
uniref:Integrase catalytic domain-containing protein n=1 Tax=Oryza brachyantha TaxID=4533 RepID=J3NCP4_ORYBR